MAQWPGWTFWGIDHPIIETRGRSESPPCSATEVTARRRDPAQNRAALYRNLKSCLCRCCVAAASLPNSLSVDQMKAPPQQGVLPLDGAAGDLVVSSCTIIPQHRYACGPGFRRPDCHRLHVPGPTSSCRRSIGTQVPSFDGDGSVEGDGIAFRVGICCERRDRASFGRCRGAASRSFEA